MAAYGLAGGVRSDPMSGRRAFGGGGDPLPQTERGLPFALVELQNVSDLLDSPLDSGPRRSSHRMGQDIGEPDEAAVVALFEQLVLSALHDPDDLTRQAAVSHLRWFVNPNAVVHLLPLTHDPATWVRSALGYTIGYLPVDPD
ncbi:HEAT repeat domain-containing protein [Micromonospora sp. NPDC050397]|uniref:HEAT repeat domain-containing protein n=1 Tax=Micromonospora sp. NPDC050397 TaxID=3364279 RepID=UPI0038512B88